MNVGLGDCATGAGTTLQAVVGEFVVDRFFIMADRDLRVPSRSADHDGGFSQTSQFGAEDSLGKGIRRKQRACHHSCENS